jgi:hypothetical protein
MSVSDVDCVLPLAVARTVSVYVPAGVDSDLCVSHRTQHSRRAGQPCCCHQQNDAPLSSVLFLSRCVKAFALIHLWFLPSYEINFS